MEQDLKDRVIFNRYGLIIFNKLPGEDSEKLPELLGDDLRVLSRLDKPVAGLIPLIKPGIDGEDFIFEKIYTAVVSGDPGDKGRFEDLIFHDRRNNKTFVVKGMRKGVKEAVLSFERLAYDRENDLSLVRIRLETGRTHQIRIQFASRKMPLAGDGKYGSRVKLPFVSLMASEIKVMDRDYKEIATVSAPLPKVFPWDLYC